MVLPVVFITALFISLVASLPSSLDNVPSTVNNCSGTSLIHLPDYFEASGGYGPQITGSYGWEEWSFAINFNANNSLMVGKWIRGDPAAKDSNPLGPATFTLFTNFANGTTFSFSIQDKFVYTEGNNTKKMSIGDTYLLWDGNVGVWNISINANGFTFATSTIIMQPFYPFIPRYEDQRALLVDGYHTSIDVPRGHMGGALRFPWGLEWVVVDVCSFKHSYATKPIQDVLSSYTRGTSFLGNVPPISTVDWYHARSCKGKEVDAIYFAKQTDWNSVTGVEGSPLDLKYQLTDDPTLLNLTTSSFNTSITLAGCEAQGNSPLRWDTYPIMQRGSFKDSAGGVTQYLAVNVSTTLWYNNTSTYVLGGLGFIEVYNSG